MDIQEYIDMVRWQTAKSGDHQYTVKVWTPELSDAFDFFVEYIKEHGYKEKFYRTEYTYFQINHYVYWSMTDDSGETILINRKVAIEPQDYLE